MTVPTDPYSLQGYDDVEFAGNDDPTNVQSVTDQVIFVFAMALFEVICSETRLHCSGCVMSDIVLLKQKSRIVFQER